PPPQQTPRARRIILTSAPSPPLPRSPPPTAPPTSFFFQPSRDHPDLHSFPTRRSSDLGFHHRPVDHELDLIGHLAGETDQVEFIDRKSTRLNSSHVAISYAVFCLKKKKI